VTSPRVAGGALDGIHVVSIAVNVPGPVATSRLAQLGARVTKVEPPNGDPLSRYAPAWYDELRRAVEVTTLDLASATGRAALDSLLGAADALITSLRSSSLARLALDPDDVAMRHPRLCQVAIVGQPRPDHEVSGHDLTYQAAAGLTEPPRLPRVLVADLAGAERVVTAVLALLLERTRTGRGGRMEVALADAARDFAAPFLTGLTDRDGVLGGADAGYGWYRAADGWVAVAALEARFVDRLARESGAASLDRTSLTTMFAARTVAVWSRWASEHDVPLAGVPDAPALRASRNDPPRVLHTE
jgi:alpha-methylacyl-CoA racemase